MTREMPNENTHFKIHLWRWGGYVYIRLGAQAHAWGVKYSRRSRGD